MFRLGHVTPTESDEVRLRRLEDAESGYPTDTGFAEPDKALAGSATTMPDPHVQYLAHHWLILAGPAFLPAILVVGVVLYIAIKDRRSADSSEHASSVDDQQD